MTDYPTIQLPAQSAPPTRRTVVPVNLVRGGLIGTAETIPGISGGTVALVTGVYDTLIASADNLLTAVRYAASDRRHATAALRAVAWATVVPVMLGMGAAVIAAARLLEPVLDEYPVHTRAVFLGMIAASIVIPLRRMDTAPRGRDWTLIAVSAFGVAVLVGLPPASVEEPRLWLVAVVAAVAVSALVLPGVSGSLLMLIVGVYDPTIEAVNDRDLPYLAVFAAGAIVGLATVVKGLNRLLRTRRQVTLAVMTGLMIGSLRALWPWQDDDRVMSAPDGDTPAVLALAVLGSAAIVLAMVLESRRGSSARHRA